MSDVAAYTLPELVGRTFALMRANWLPTFAVAVPLTAGYVAVEADLVPRAWNDTLFIALFAAATVAQHAIFRTALAEAGAPLSHGGRLAAFIGQSIAAWLAITAGFLLLIVPGLILMARWWVAGPVLLSSDAGILEALDESWRQTKGRFWPIAGIVVAT